MKRRFSLFVAVFVLIMAMLVFVPAPSVEEDQTSVVNSISLKLDDSNGISWEVDGYSSKGFKVVWSQNEHPVYPTRSGDKYHYYSDPNRNEDELDAFSGKGIYYVRVCEYLGGACGLYSNEVQISLGGDEEDKLIEDEDKEDSVEEEEEKNLDTELEDKNETTNESEDDFVGESGLGEEIQCRSGCLLEDVCYPLGHRKNEMYCADSLEFVNQSEDDGLCQNNFECQSNVCVSGTCFDQGLLNKIFSWLKNFFS